MIGSDRGVLWFSPQKLIWLNFDVGNFFFLLPTLASVKVDDEEKVFLFLESRENYKKK